MVSVPAEEAIRPFHWRITALAGLAFAGNGIDAGVVSFALPGIRTEWQLTPAELGLIIPAFGVGQLLGAVLGGIVADRLGRRGGFCITATTAGVAMGLAALATHPTLLGLFLLLAGLGFGGVAPVAASLVSEFAPAQHRGRMIAWTQVFWVAGWCAASLAGGLFAQQLGWRGLLALGSVTLVIGVVGWLLVPESPRLLLARGLPEAAAALSGDLSRRYGIHVPFSGLARSVPPSSAGRQLAELWGRALRRRTFALWTTWISMNAILAGPIYWLPVLLASRGTEVAFQTSAMVGVSMLPGTLLSVVLIDRIGRRPLMLLSLGTASVGTLPFMIADQPLWVGVGAAAVAAGVLAAWPVVLAWASEQYPTRIRASAVGWASGSARLGAIGAPAVTGALLGPAGDNRAAAVLPFAVLLLAAFIFVMLFAEETAGRTLEELTG